MNELLAPSIVQKLVGVIDLKQGHAVHAIAGERASYQPIPFCNGDALTLARHYLQLGVDSIYIADLDALGGEKAQLHLIDQLCSQIRTKRTLLDVGLHGEPQQYQHDSILPIMRANPHVRWIAASESCQTLKAIKTLAQIIPPERMLVGLDFRGGDFLAADPDPAAWIRASASEKFDGAVVLDLATVGTCHGISTTETCRRVKEIAPNLTLYSGGGIRNPSDLSRLSKAGCDHFLVATALYPR